MESKIENFKPEARQAGLSVDIDRQQFALALKTWRLRQSLTQKQVAERWEVSRYTIMRAEAGKDITWMMAYRLFSKLSWELRKEADSDDL